MNDYEVKRAERIERLRERSANLAAGSAASIASARARMDRIPFGQPILVGHHSESKHRRDIARYESGMRKGFEMADEAKDLARRADAAEMSSAVSSDDPDAVVKLLEQIEEEKACKSRMVEGNKALRAGKPDSEVLTLFGWSPDKQRTLDIWRSMGHKVVPIANLNANIRRLEKRVEELRAKASRPIPEPIVVGDVRIEESENRVRIFFPGKPVEALRSALKASGFKWAPSVGAWQRMASWMAWDAAKRIVGEPASSEE